MNRRSFVASVAASAAALAGDQSILAQEAAKGGASERPTIAGPGPKPAIALNHLGFLSNAQKKIIYRVTEGTAPTEFVVRELGYPLKSFQLTLPLNKVAGDFGVHVVGDFSQLDREAQYVASAGGEDSVPFFVRNDAWRRTLPKAVAYHKYQRCGVAVPNVHPACHLDDALRRDTGEHVDTTGGWHDAGDVRKWMDVTMLPAIGLMNLARNLGEEWDLAESGLNPIFEEVKWGNRYFLKMQNADGRVWADTAGGVKGDNSDNHWTDNIIGTPDDRHINVTCASKVQAIFITVQALVAQVFRQHDPGYGQQCLEAARRCWQANKQEGTTLDLGWWLIAAVESDRAVGGNNQYGSAVPLLAQKLLTLQNKQYVGSQKIIRGFWMTDGNKPYHSGYFPATMPQALMEAALAYPDHPDASLWRDAVRRNLEDYVIPLCHRSVYEIMPLGVFLNPPNPEQYRPLAGEMVYRYFDPHVLNGEWAGALNAHVLGYAVMLARAAEVFQDRNYRNLAYRHLEWVMGANPFGACLMSGEGYRNPYPFSVLTGLIPGGIMNGISGTSHDVPVLSYDCGRDYRTCEYWSPHNAYYEWALSLLERKSQV